jgi:uncharacterized protein YceK
MTRRTIPAVLLIPFAIVALVVSTSACGTIANFNGGSVGWISAPSESPPPPIAYGGVQWDIERGLKSEADIGTKVLIFPLWLIDLGVSATLDTLTLPVVFSVNAWQAWNRATGEPSAARPASSTSTRRGWFPEPFELGKVTLAESILNPPATNEDPD